MSQDNLDTPVEAGTPAPEDNNPLLVNTNTPADPAPAGDPAPAVTPTWREDWRQALASNDEKELARLNRFTSPEKVYEAYRNLETKLSSGQFKQPLPDNATPEQLAAYRKANGIPEKPEGYFEKLPDGVVVGEEDKAAMGYLAQRLHAKNVSPEVFNEVMDVTFKLIEHNQQEAVAAQLEIKEQSRQKLYETWGPAEYKVNINAIANMMASMPQSLRARFEGAQLADGTLMFNDYEAMTWWAQHVRENNPALAVMPAGTTDAMQSIEQELASNREMMRKPSEWFAKGNTERRNRHTQLLDTLEKMKRRA